MSPIVGFFFFFLAHRVTFFFFCNIFIAVYPIVDLTNVFLMMGLESSFFEGSKKK